MVKRAVISPGRRNVVGQGSGSEDAIALDDRPLSLQVTRDGKRLIVCLPFEVWICHSDSLALEKSIELASPVPSVCEGHEDGTLWFGGHHLHRGSTWTTTATKFGSKLGGFVDRVCAPRPRLVCGAGSHGEVLIDTETEEVVHRRKVPEHEVLAMVASPDGRVLWSDGGNHGWVIDPDHPSGYMKLKLRHTSAAELPSEAIVALGVTSARHCVLGARDGAIAWTNPALRPIGERVPKMDLRGATPLAIAGDERWIYVLRPGSILQRFLVEQPPPEPGAKTEPEPLPELQSVRLSRPASCLALLPGGYLAVAGPQADDQLGCLWREKVDDLPWKGHPVIQRVLVDATSAEAEATGAGAHKAPSFVATRTKLSGPPLAQLRVDDVLGAPSLCWLTRHTGVLTERPVEQREADQVLAADSLLLPAMIRFQEGTARPALILWPGVADESREVPGLQWLTWGDRPRGWIELTTPEIRAQGWSRREVFPLQVALAHPPPQVAGRRPEIPARWVDHELFTAMVNECKHLLKVLW